MGRCGDASASTLHASASGAKGKSEKLDHPGALGDPRARAALAQVDHSSQGSE
jgi:hypothetical protein